ncbi:hypothetical protein GS489_08145 [Rhodococcus hoagii]|nr:hypothetical protein [Prescottella equi]
MTNQAVYCDEISLMNEDFVNMLVSRHSVEGRVVGGDDEPGRPEASVEGELHRPGRRDGAPHLPLRAGRQPALPPGRYIENLSRQYTGLWHDRFIKGLWTMADGVITSASTRARHVVDTLPTMQRVLAVGVDYGTTNPTRGIKLGLGDDNRLYAMAEWAPGTGTTADRETGLRASVPPIAPNTCSSTLRPPSSRFSYNEADGVAVARTVRRRTERHEPRRRRHRASCPAPCRPTNYSSTRRAPNCSGKSPATCGTTKAAQKGEDAP